MARLNEPPVVGESIDSLKRRFMRQNRELARSNSELKIKVATLQADQAQLLSENITLRDQNIRFREEQDRDYTKRALENAAIVKNKLAAKVAELTELMSELQTAHEKPVKQTSVQKPSRRISFYKSPGHTQAWKSSLYGPQATGLAPIVEDKLFPRRTLGADDIQYMQMDTAIAESPELGPPPVAHFEATEILLNDDMVTETDVQEPTTSIAEEADSKPGLFTNLETRRKRRTSALLRDLSDQQETSVERNATENVSLQEPLLKAGAKRKFGTREEEDNGPRPAVPDHISFLFSRKSGASIEKSTTREIKPLPERNPTKTTGSVRSVGLDNKARKALDEKTVNTDPIVSPVKSRVLNSKTGHTSSSEKVKEVSKARPRSREEPRVEKATKSRSVIEVPPATPAPIEADLFSPTDSLPSTKPGRDTPPPSELTTKISETARPSRRQRAQVSYAEPSLRDKMRRPGKELADAVVLGKTTKEETAVKEEPTERAKWENLPIGGANRNAEPTSPLQSKSTKSAQPEILSEGTAEEKDKSKAALAAILARQRRVSKARQPEPGLEGSSSDLFSLDGSSPDTTTQKNTAGRQSRRHSSMAEIKRQDVSAHSRSTENKSDTEGGTRAERMVSRRRSMQV